MTVDNRTELTDCDATTGWTGDGPVDVDNTAGFVYEGTNAITTQHTNTDENIYTTTQTGGASFPEDLSDATVYMILKDNLLQTTANGGVQMVLQSGTNRPGYGVGGNDDTGIQLAEFWNGYKLDVTTRASAPYSNNYQGTAASYAPASTNAVGLGTVHLAKAQGNVDNIKLDRFSFHANGTYAFTINGGTVMTPETMADVAADDLTNGWGVFANPLGAQYSFYAPCEFGNPTATADVNFDAIDEQWTWIGGRVGATHFPFRIVGNATDTINIKFENLSITNTGTRAEFIVGDANVDTIDWDNVTLTGLGTTTFINDAGHTYDGVTFNDVSQIVPNNCDASAWVVNGSTTNGTMLFNATGESNNLDGVNFTSSGTGHAIEISVAGTYDFNDFFFSGFGADGTTNAAVFISANVAVTINILGGDTPTVRNSGTAPTLNNSVTVLVNGVAEGTAVKVLANETAGTVTSGDTILEGLADSTGSISTSLNYEGAFGAGLDVLVRARNQGIPTAAVADDGGVLTDETTAANSSTTNDMTLTPATPVVNDAYYWGHPEEPKALKINISTAGSGLTITWEYWNGSSWTALSGVTDGTNSFTSAGLARVTWTQPVNWATTTVNSQGPYYYFRARVSAVMSPSQALGRWSSLDVTRYLPIPGSGDLVRTITSAGLTATLSQAEDTISSF